jgi:DNA mismatch endonuclease (patch repair protein)
MDNSKASWASSPSVRRVMQGNRSRDTAPELAIRRLLHSYGLRYRIHVRPIQTLNRRADVVFRSAKVAVFIDGCFWHGCPRHARMPASNSEFWEEKISTNRARDLQTDRLLRREGWAVIRVWEHERAETAARRIEKAVRSRR